LCWGYMSKNELAQVVFMASKPKNGQAVIFAISLSYPFLRENRYLQGICKIRRIKLTAIYIILIEVDKIEF
jgi:hypothetical protein